MDRKVSRIFIIGTGRTGSKTVAAALLSQKCFTVGHESRWGLSPSSSHLYKDRLSYPENHIEIDGALVFFVPHLLARYPDAMFVHLSRNEDLVALSIARRSKLKPTTNRIMRAARCVAGRGNVLAGIDIWVHGILRTDPQTWGDLKVLARDYGTYVQEIVNAIPVNNRLMDLKFENIEHDLTQFLEALQCDYDKEILLQNLRTVRDRTSRVVTTSGNGTKRFRSR